MPELRDAPFGELKKAYEERLDKFNKREPDFFVGKAYGDPDDCDVRLLNICDIKINEANLLNKKVSVYSKLFALGQDVIRQTVHHNNEFHDRMEQAILDYLSHIRDDALFIAKLMVAVRPKNTDYQEIWLNEAVKELCDRFDLKALEAACSTESENDKYLEKQRVNLTVNPNEEFRPLMLLAKAIDAKGGIVPDNPPGAPQK